MPGHDPFRAPEPLPRLEPPAELAGRRPRVLAHVLRAMPGHNAGAERMLHGVLEGLVARGWDARIIAVEHRGPAYERGGITVEALTDAQMREPYTWCDVAITHLDVTPMALSWARYGRPLLHLVHNHTQLLHHHVPDNGSNIAVWNSEWVIDAAGGWHGPQVICRPPTDPDEHRAGKPPKQRTATLVNLLGEKGGPLFWRLARRLPDWRFLGVEGAYGFQTIPNPMPPNGLLVRNGATMRDVWAETSVYLAPSWYESWGLAAVEALHSGRPVIAHPTPGLRESLGDAAIFVDRDDDQGWVDALTILADPRAYKHWSQRATARSAELARLSVDDLDRLAALCVELAEVNQGAQREDRLPGELPT